MSGNELSEALTDVSEEKICGAMGAYRRKRRGVLLRVASIAAMLALVVGFLFWPRKVDGYVVAPGVVKVYAYDLTSGSTVDTMIKRELKNGIKLPLGFGWSWGINCVYGLPITLEVQEQELADKEITIDMTVPYGDFLGDKFKRPDKYSDPIWSEARLGQDFTVENGETIYWNNIKAEHADEPYEGEIVRYEGSIFVDIVIKADGVIVGYAVIEIESRSGSIDRDFFAVIHKSVYYPPVNGEFQNVTEEYVRTQIEKVK